MEKSDKPKRVQFDFSAETWEIVEQLRVKTGATSKAEVLRRAIALYAWFTSEVNQDDIVEIKDKKDKLIYRMSGKFFRF